MTTSFSTEYLCSDYYAYFRKYYGNKTDEFKIPHFFKLPYISNVEQYQQEHHPWKRYFSGLESIFESIFPIYTVADLYKNVSQYRYMYLYSHYELNVLHKTHTQCVIENKSYLTDVHIYLYKVALVMNNDGYYRYISQSLTPVCMTLTGLPLMTSNCTYIFNGIEKTIISQLQRSPGIYAVQRTATDAKQRTYKVLPSYGNTFYIEWSKSQKLYFKIGKYRRISPFIYLRTLGVTIEELVTLFFNFIPIVHIKYFIHSNHYTFLPLIHCMLWLYSTSDYEISDFKFTKIILNKEQLISKSILNSILNATFYVSIPNKYVSAQLYCLENNINFSYSYILNSYSNWHNYITTKHQDSTSTTYVASQTVLNIRELVTMFDTFRAEWSTLLREDRIVSYIQHVFGNTGATLNKNNVALPQLSTLYHHLYNPLYYNLSIAGRNHINAILQLPSSHVSLSLSKIDYCCLIYQLLSKKANQPGSSWHKTSDMYDMSNRKVRLFTDLFSHLLLMTLLAIKRRKVLNMRNELDIAHLKSQSQMSVNTSRFNLKIHLSVKQRASLWILYEQIATRQHLHLDTILSPAGKLYKQAIDLFLIRSTLSQLLDDLNPLARLTHIRRISLLGPDGLTKDNVSMETRDVQSSFFGRLCPIETPEGKSVGVVNSLAIYSGINSCGELVSPYLAVNSGNVVSEIHMLTSIEEEKTWVSTSTATISDDNSFAPSDLYAHNNNNYINIHSSLIKYSHIASKQILSVSANCIPFVEHNDGNRALMGANMQRQAVQSLVAETPYIGTGVDSTVASLSTINTYVSDILIDISNLYKYRYTKVISHFKKVNRVLISNASRPLTLMSRCQLHDRILSQSNTFFVKISQNALIKYRKGNQKNYYLDKIQNVTFCKNLDAGFTNNSLYLGHNLSIGYISMNGYSFEDSLVISERLMRNGLFTSLHTKEVEVYNLDNSQYEDRISMELLPNSAAFGNLDAQGIVKPGTRVVTGDILVAKVRTMKRKHHEKPLTSQRNAFLQNLLNLHVLNNIRRKTDISEKYLFDSSAYVLDVRKTYYNNDTISTQNILHELKSTYFDVIYQVFDLLLIKVIGYYDIQQTFIQECKQQIFRDRNLLIKQICVHMLVQTAKRIVHVHYLLYLLIHKAYLQKSCLLLLQTVYKNHYWKVSASPVRLVKITLGMLNIPKAGDKLTGRHGNKGVIAQVLSEAEMPHLPNGMALDIALNPIGISSRMNLGQVFEVHLAMTAHHMGKHLHMILHNASIPTKHALVQQLRHYLLFIYSDSRLMPIINSLNHKQILEITYNFIKGFPLASNPLNGTQEDDIHADTLLANMHTLVQQPLVDGKTGELFDRLTTVGFMYILKLNHMVDDKIHARLTGPYNRVTEQPLGGKAMLGGQRFGEMEVWTLQAYGVSYTLVEMLTIKSDSRNSAAISSLQTSLLNPLNSSNSLPESFNVLLRELWCLGLHIYFI